MSVLPRTSILLPLVVLATALVPQPALAQDDDGWRTIEFETTEVTRADVTVSPDGEWLIFTILGHLFRLPVKGGTAEQLTFGPYYDSDPVFSPDGRRVAFGSDRDGTEGNVFVLRPHGLRFACGRHLSRAAESQSVRPQHRMTETRFGRPWRISGCRCMLRASSILGGSRCPSSRARLYSFRSWFSPRPSCAGGRTEAAEFRDRFRAKWSLLLEKGHSEEDLLISTLVVLGQFKAASA